jgi:hypothetical protein
MDCAISWLDFYANPLVGLRPARLPDGFSVLTIRFFEEITRGAQGEALKSPLMATPYAGME